MDIVSHALWGYASLRWRGVRPARAGALAGATPDLLYFVPSTVERVVEQGWSGLRVGSEPGIWSSDGPPLPPALVEAYERYYVWTHSLVVLAAAVAIILLARRRAWAWLSIPYGLHVVMDIPTHERYQTPFLYPLSTFTVEGVSWGHPLIFWPNWVAIFLVLYWLRRRYGRREAAPTNGGP